MGLPTYLLAYAGGLLLATQVSIPTGWSLGAALVSGLCWIPLRRFRWAPGLLLLFFALFGLHQYHRALAPPPSASTLLTLSQQNIPVILEGKVIRLHNRPDERSALDINLCARITPEGAQVQNGRIRLNLNEALPDVSPGQKVRFRTRLKSPRTFGTPGEFDYPRHLASEGIFVTGFLEKAQELVVFARQDRPSPGQRIEIWRQRTGRIIDRTVDPPTVALVRALIIGDQGKVAREQLDLMSRAGVSHLFAISGMHLAFLAALLYAVGKALYRRSQTLMLMAPPARVIPLVLIPPLCFYLLFTGASISTIRAFLMAAAMAFLVFRRRNTTPLRLLATAAFVMLCLYPLALFQPAFQLSFAGLVGILALMPRLQIHWRQSPPWVRYSLNLLASTACATLTTIPLVLWQFHLFAPAGLLTNLFSIPLIDWGAVPLGLAGALLSPLSEWAGGLLFNGCALIIELALKGCALIISIPGLQGRQWFITSGIFALLCTLVLVLLLPAQNLRARMIALSLAGMAALLPAMAPNRMGDLRISALSVGQGDATLIGLPDGRNLLVDGGGLRSSSFDTGQRLVAPALGRLGIRHLDAVVLTHDHPDHSKGLAFILRNFSVSEFWAPKPAEELNPDLAAALKESGIAVRQFPEGWSLLEAPEGATLALHNPRTSYRDENDRSLSLYLRNGRDGLLLLGDLEADGVAGLLSEPLPGPVNLLKLPHHGSKGSSADRLLENLRPQTAFVSVGYANTFGFPHPQVLEILEQLSIPLYRTDLHGSIHLSSAGEGWKARTEKQGL